MKTTWLSLVLACMLFACKENGKNEQINTGKEFDILTLPTEWVELTKTDSGMIIFNSCDGGNLLISLSKSKDTTGLLLHGTQEDYDFVVLRSGLMDNDTVLVNAKWRDGNVNQDFKFVWVDEAKHIGKWMTTYKESNYVNYVEYICVTADRQKDFKTVNQPCRECWGDECDEKDSLWMKKDSAQNKTDSAAVIKDTIATNNP